MTLQAELLKIEGMNRVAEHNADWSEKALSELQFLASVQSELTADDLRPFIAREGQPRHPNAIGAVFSGAAKAGLIRRAGFRKSAVNSNHARYITVWKSALNP